MSKFLITGGAGFIGSNYLHYVVDKYPEDEFVCLDALTYAGNYNNIKKLEEKPNYKFVKMDIRDKDAILELFKKEKFDYVINFAAESHVDNSIKNPNIFAETNILGTMNLLNAAKYMTEYLIGKGHKNIGFIGVYEEDRSVGLERENGYIAALKENDLEVDMENLKLGDFSYESGYELTKKLIKKKNIPTAIFAVTDNLAIATIDCLKDNGLNVPEDVAVVSIGY